MICSGHGADGQLSVGKEVWLFHGKLDAGVNKETVDVLCYSNGRSNHLEVGVSFKKLVVLRLGIVENKMVVNCQT